MHPYEREQEKISKLRNEIINLAFNDPILYRCVNSFGLSESGLLTTIITLSNIIDEQHGKIIDCMNNRTNVIYAGPLTNEQWEKLNVSN
jgi:hypothetical protein